MRGVGRLQVHGICSHRLVRWEVVETRSNYKKLGMFSNYYIDDKTFNIITLILLLIKSNYATEITTTFLKLNIFCI